MDNMDLIKGLQIARSYDVSSKENSVVLYSISFQPTQVNREKAFKYIKNNPDKIMIEHTECGAKLVETDFESIKTLHQGDITPLYCRRQRKRYRFC